MKSILSAKQFSRQELIDIYNQAYKIQTILATQKCIPVIEDYILASLFFEASTRTRLSFETAMHNLGGKVITAEGIQFSSLSKGETLYDTFKMIENYADLCVIRHGTEGISELAASNIHVPVINAGDGAKEHPTQALLDFYTIQKYKDIIGRTKENPLRIAFIGDVQYSRTIHSLIILLRFFAVEYILAYPSELELPQEYYNIINDNNIPYKIFHNLDDVVDVDILYVTRVQEERYLDRDLYEAVCQNYIIEPSFIKEKNPNSIVMHPLPRVRELPASVDSLSNAVYFDQARNGVYVRMALILSVLGKTL